MPICSRVVKSRCFVGNTNQPDSEFIKKDGTPAKVCQTCRQISAIEMKKMRGYPISLAEDWIYNRYITPDYMVHQSHVNTCLSCPLSDGCIYDTDTDYQHKECPIKRNGK